MGDNGILEVRAERVVPAAAARVFAAWLDPVQAAKFLFATEHGQIIRCEIDGQEGGEFTIVDRREGEDMEHFGEFVAISAPDRIVFDFSVNQSPASRVSVSFAGEGTSTRVTLTHAMDAQWANHAERARKGWESILDNLANAFA